MLRTMEQPATQLPVTLRLPSDETGPATARSAVELLARDLPVTIAQRLSLVVSELVTNAIRHSLVTDPRPSLTVDVTHARVTLAVHDCGLGFDREAVSGQAGAGGGWGLKLVDSLVDRWHVEHADGTRVVCEIDRSRS